IPAPSPDDRPFPHTLASHHSSTSPYLLSVIASLLLLRSARPARTSPSSPPPSSNILWLTLPLRHTAHPPSPSPPLLPPRLPRTPSCSLSASLSLPSPGSPRPSSPPGYST